MDRREVDIPYVDGPLDGNRELRERWELDEAAPGAFDGWVYEHPEEWSPGWSAETTTVHRYRLTRVDGGAGWEFRYAGSSETKR